MGIKARYPDGEVKVYQTSPVIIKEYALANAVQLLQIALSDSDERIAKTFGGEHELIALIERYMSLAEMALVFMEKEREC